jgi:prepilin-type N-terminal cleavage/methylation domain-containing protein
MSKAEKLAFDAFPRKRELAGELAGEFVSAPAAPSPPAPLPRGARGEGERGRRAKAGFSLLEMLVVIGLIAFLTAAVVVVMPRVGNAAKVSATQATIKKVDELLNDRINGFNRWIQTQNTQAGNNPPPYVINAGYGTTQYQQNPALYQILGAKYFFRQYFPQSFSEMIPAPTYNATVHKQVTESAACLYLILTQAGVFDTDPLAAADLRGLEVADTDGDGLMEIVDAWGQPLRYYRWPTRLFRPAISSGSVSTPGWNSLAPAPAPTPASLLISTATRGPIPHWTSSNYSVGQTIQPVTIVQAGVPNVMMYQCTVAGASGASEPSSWGTSAGSTTADGGVTWTAVLDPLAVDGDDPNGLASSNFINESGAQYYHTWATYHIPLIVSCGTDGLLGLFEPYDATNFGTLAQPQFATGGGLDLADMYDNLTNHQK